MAIGRAEVGLLARIERLDRQRAIAELKRHRPE
jgi:hypothetical protein